MDENMNEYESEYYTLTDENGNEMEFEVIGSADISGVTYFAMVPADIADPGEDGIIEYVLLKKDIDGDGEDVFVTIDDDEEFDMVSAYFDDIFDSEEDYDA